jgi:hypothetical protein
VTSLSVRRGGATPTAVTVHEQAGRWTVAERADYPADVSKLRKLLLALSDAKVVEEKTSNPASFPVIGVEDPALPGASGAQITVVAKDGKHAVIIGKPFGEGNFARRAGENTSYSVEPGISFEAAPRYWIDPRLLDVAASNVLSVAVKPASGPAYTLHRAAAADPFTLDGIPPGRQAADAASLSASSTAFSGLTADDVAPAADVDFSKASVATVTGADGNVLTITGAVNGDKHWIELQTTKDAALNAKAAGRAFEVAGYRFDSVFRPLEQLLVPKPPPPQPPPVPSPKKKPPLPPAP